MNQYFGESSGNLHDYDKSSCPRLGSKQYWISPFSVATEPSNSILSSQYFTVWPKTASLNYKTVTKFGLFITVIWLFTDNQHLVAPTKNHFEQTRPKYKHSPLTLPSWAVFCFSDKKNKSAEVRRMQGAAQYISKQTGVFLSCVIRNGSFELWNTEKMALLLL